MKRLPLFSVLLLCFNVAFAQFTIPSDIKIVDKPIKPIGPVIAKKTWSDWAKTEVPNMEYHYSTVKQGQVSLEVRNTGNKTIEGEFTANRCGAANMWYPARIDPNGTVSFDYPSNGCTSFYWWFRNISQKEYYYIKAQNGQYMTVLNNNQNSGTPVVLANFTGDNSQRWELGENSTKGNDGIFFFRTPSGKALDIPWNKSEDGTSLHIWDFHGGAAQQWKLPVISGSINTELRCNIQSGVDTRTIDFCSNGRPIYIWSYNGSNCQVWTLVRIR